MNISKKIFMTLFCFMVLLFHTTTYADVCKYSYGSYKEAQDSNTQIKFDMASTKLGLFTSHFSGFVKSFTIQSQIVKDKIQKGASVDFQVKDLDTDIDGRNEKMWNHCLDMEHNPSIKITIASDIDINGIVTELPAMIIVRGESFPILLNVKVERKTTGVEAHITGKISIQKLKIPDPSIAVASVRDEIDLEAKILWIAENCATKEGI